MIMEEKNDDGVAVHKHDGYEWWHPVSRIHEYDSNAEKKPEDFVATDNIVLALTPVNNHGCSGMWVEIEPTSSTEGIVVDGRSCLSCWRGNSPISIGALVELPEGFGWKSASQEDLDYQEPRDVSNNERTVVTPEELVVLEDKYPLEISFGDPLNNSYGIIFWRGSNSEDEEKYYSSKKRITIWIRFADALQIHKKEWIDYLLESFLDRAKKYRWDIVNPMSVSEFDTEYSFTVQRNEKPVFHDIEIQEICKLQVWQFCREIFGRVLPENGRGKKILWTGNKRFSSSCRWQMEKLFGGFVVDERHKASPEEISKIFHLDGYDEVMCLEEEDSDNDPIFRLKGKNYYLKRSIPK